MPSIAQHIHCVDFFIGSPMLRAGREVRSGRERQFCGFALYLGGVVRYSVCVGRKSFPGNAEGELFEKISTKQETGRECDMQP